MEKTNVSPRAFHSRYVYDTSDIRDQLHVDSDLESWLSLSEKIVSLMFTAVYWQIVAIPGVPANSLQDKAQRVSKLQTVSISE